MCENSVSVETRKRIHELCKTHLNEGWTETDLNDLDIRPIPDGFVNQSFFCFLSEKVKSKYNKVVIRFVDYESFKGYYDYTHVLAITLLLAQKKIAPKVLASFEYGTITEFIKSRYVSAHDNQDTELVQRLAQILANFHSQNMPVPKNKAEDSLVGIYDRWFGTIRESYLFGKVREEINKSNYPLIRKYNLVDEMDWLRKVIVDMNSPIVFSHNDFNRRNILIRESEDSSDADIFLIDFDWTTYNYRGADFGQYFCNWGHKDTDPEWVFSVFPSDQDIYVFINAYIKRMTNIFGKTYAEKEINSSKRLIKETKVHAMNAYIRDCIYCIQKVDKTEQKEFMLNFENRFRCYSELKNRFLKEYANNEK